MRIEVRMARKGLFYKKSYRNIRSYLESLLGHKFPSSWKGIYKVIRELTDFPVYSRDDAVEAYSRIQNGELPIDAKKLVKLIARIAQSSSQKPCTSQDTRKFYASYQWRKLRYQTLQRYGRKCMCCGSVDGPFHVDHIKPLRRYWELRLDPENTQVLCEACNHGKGGWDETDFRGASGSLEALADEFHGLIEKKSYN